MPIPINFKRKLGLTEVEAEGGEVKKRRSKRAYGPADENTIKCFQKELPPVLPSLDSPPSMTESFVDFIKRDMKEFFEKDLKAETTERSDVDCGTSCKSSDDRNDTKLNVNADIIKKVVSIDEVEEGSINSSKTSQTNPAIQEETKTSLKLLRLQVSTLTRELQSAKDNLKKERHKRSTVEAERQEFVNEISRLRFDVKSLLNSSKDENRSPLDTNNHNHYEKFKQIFYQNIELKKAVKDLDTALNEMNKESKLKEEKNELLRKDLEKERNMSQTLKEQLTVEIAFYKDKLALMKNEVEMWSNWYYNL